MITQYSIAIRTLGLAGENFIKCLDSIFKQSILPKKVIIYIADGYSIPSERVGYEEYIYVTKGMVAQRALEYNEIETEYILLLDDDVELAPNSAEILLKQMQLHQADCIAADTFKNHKMSFCDKIYNALLNFTFPVNNLKWAFKINPSGGYFYINNPTKDYYKSQSAAGPASLWKKIVLQKIKLRDELWLDNLGFAYGDDAVIFYKLYINNYNLGVSFNCGITHLNACSSSSKMKTDAKRLKKRSKALYIIWHRTCYKNSTAKSISVSLFVIKSLLSLLLHILAIIPLRDYTAPFQMLKGTLNGIKYTHSDEYRAIPNFKL